MADVSVEQIEACLPQTQCTRCSYPCCHDYAAALAENEAGINQCPPGGEVTIGKLAALLGRPTLPLDPDFGTYMPRLLAYIHEDLCIGCVLCIKACPVDAIVGANKLMHTVIQAHCTGCELCIPVCPTDCIEMQAGTEPTEPVSDWPGYSWEDIRLGKQRYTRRQRRLTRTKKKETESKSSPTLDRQQAILEAVRRKQKLKKQ